MTQPLEMDLQERSVGVYPPSFCNWRLLLAVMVITEVSVILVGLGRGGLPGWQWLAMSSLFAQWMALFCASGLCVMSSWTGRFSPRGAWIGSWLIAIALSAAFSFASWQMSDIALPGLIGDSAGMFVLKSAFAVGLVAVVFFLYLEIRARWRSELIAQAEARVQALQARIRPHFLFNSLNTIASLIPDDPDSAEAATLDLADIFRGSMRRADQLISLSDELSLARQYLDMERRRLGSRLQVDWRVEELPPGASVLPLMLQPLLENAVAHGVQALQEGGKIAVYGRSEGERIVVTIGNPLAPEGSDTSGHGMAIRNIRERLALAFGSRASLLTSQDQDQFYAVLSLPYVEHSDY
ncbi:MAG: histidine kinase [Xanthomonadales bacterium]|jgi:two-component system sensor histidine kinase AlgZ|nr:histidine kinase [Xanthomonadales bacterium]MDH3940867.1 histidine kinase [Xanthomonadales bacterium]MDH4001723.1 histidine kinase [Xanthomonadales bacterium]